MPTLAPLIEFYLLNLVFVDLGLHLLVCTQGPSGHQLSYLSKRHLQVISYYEHHFIILILLLKITIISHLLLLCIHRLLSDQQIDCLLLTHCYLQNLVDCTLTESHLFQLLLQSLLRVHRSLINIDQQHHDSLILIKLGHSQVKFIMQSHQFASKLTPHQMNPQLTQQNISRFKNSIENIQKMIQKSRIILKKSRRYNQPIDSLTSEASLQKREKREISQSIVQQKSARTNSSHSKKHFKTPPKKQYQNFLQSLGLNKVHSISTKLFQSPKSQPKNDKSVKMLKNVQRWINASLEKQKLKQKGSRSGSKLKCNSITNLKNVSSSNVTSVPSAQLKTIHGKGKRIVNKQQLTPSTMSMSAITPSSFKKKKIVLAQKKLEQDQLLHTPKSHIEVDLSFVSSITKSRENIFICDQNEEIEDERNNPETQAKQNLKQKEEDGDGYNRQCSKPINRPPEQPQSTKSKHELSFEEKLKRYGFVERYLSTQEISAMYKKLKNSKIPQSKWPLTVVDQVYKKMKKKP